MKVVIYGATGMIGQGTLRECLNDPDVTEVLAVGRSPLATKHPKLRELLLKDLTDYAGVGDALAGFDACLYCLGVSSAGMNEADYTRVTYDFTVAAAKALLAASPGITMCFISGASTDASEKGSVMWARVKGRAENALLAMPFKAAYMFRPGFIEALDGITSRTPLYRVLYVFFKPLVPVAKLFWAKHMLTTRSLGQAMLVAAKRGAPKKVLEAPDINALVG